MFRYKNCAGFIGPYDFIYDKINPSGEIKYYSWWMGGVPITVGVNSQFSITFIDEFGQDICTACNDNLYSTDVIVNITRMPTRYRIDDLMSKKKMKELL